MNIQSMQKEDRDLIAQYIEKENKYKQKQQELEQTIQHLKTKQNNMKAEYNKIKNEYNANQKQIEMENHQLKDTNDEFRAMQQEVIILSTRNANLEQQLEEMKSKYTELKHVQLARQNSQTFDGSVNGFVNNGDKFSNQKDIKPIKGNQSG
eukprot:73308_1